MRIRVITLALYSNPNLDIQQNHRMREMSPAVFLCSGDTAYERERRVPLFRFRNDEPGRSALRSGISKFELNILAVEELAR